MVKVLQVLPTLNVCGGVENYLMNYYLNMDLSDMSIDFCVHEISGQNFKEDIQKRGGNIYSLPKFSVKNFRQISTQMRQIFSNNHYDIIHCHQANAAYFYFKSAKESGIKCRILHSHQAAAADKWSHAVRNLPLLSLGKKYANEFMACSKLAGDYLFGNKTYKVINNAVDVEKFAFNSAKRNLIREKLGLGDDFCIGHIGRFCRQKNQKFLLEVFCKFIKIRPNSKLLFIGDGESFQECVNFASKLGIKDKVLFLGSRPDARDFYQAMDVFALPSLYEGLPVVGVEAQYNGLTLLLSDKITKETDFSGHCKFIPLRATDWLDSLSNSFERHHVDSTSYDIHFQAPVLKGVYSMLATKYS